MGVLKDWLKTQDGLSQEGLARRVGVSTPFMCNLLGGKHPLIRIDLLNKLHDATGIPMESIVQDLLREHEAKKERADV